MPSFFFHLTNGDTFPDDRATACGTLDEAKTVALAVAAELGRNRPADEIAHLSVRVTDEHGSEVFRTKVVNLQHATKADECAHLVQSQADNPSLVPYGRPNEEGPAIAMAGPSSY